MTIQLLTITIYLSDGTTVAIADDVSAPEASMALNAIKHGEWVLVTDEDTTWINPAAVVKIEVTVAESDEIDPPLPCGGGD